MAFHVMARFIVVCFILYSSNLSARALYTQAPAQKQKEAVPSPQELYERLSASVFIVESLDAAGAIVAKGSAVAVASDEVITNRHVIEGGVSWRLKRGNKTWPTTITHLDSDHDLCQLRAKGLAAPPVPVRYSATLAVGERVYAIGSPEGLELTLSEGLISGLREFEKARIIQTSAAISPGSSGGGLFDAQGHLIGITTSYIKEGQNLNFALPGEWVSALAKHEPADSIDPKSESSVSQALIWFEVGSRASDAHDNEGALRAFKKAVHMKPDFAPAWCNLGVAYGNLERNVDAIEAYQECIRLEPRLGVGAWYNLGISYSNLARYDDAIRAYQETIRLKPDDSGAWFNLCVAYGNLERYSQAVKACQEAIRLKPDDADGWHNLCTAHANSGHNADAIKACQEAIRLRPDFAVAWYGLGVSYAQQGDRAKVTQVYEKLRQVNPELADQFLRKVVLP
jgi:Flp pilus assembly protein TadD